MLARRLFVQCKACKERWAEIQRFADQLFGLQHHCKETDRGRYAIGRPMSHNQQPYTEAMWSRKWFEINPIQHKVGAKGPTKCDHRCMGAKGPQCDCQCNGKNHGAAYAPM